MRLTDHWQPKTTIVPVNRRLSDYFTLYNSINEAKQLDCPRYVA